MREGTQFFCQLKAMAQETTFSRRNVYNMDEFFLGFKEFGNTWEHMAAVEKKKKLQCAKTSKDSPALNIKNKASKAFEEWVAVLLQNEEMEDAVKTMNAKSAPLRVCSRRRRPLDQRQSPRARDVTI
jgi:hypothetical protein